MIPSDTSDASQYPADEAELAALSLRQRFDGVRRVVVVNPDAEAAVPLIGALHRTLGEDASLVLMGGKGPTDPAILGKPAKHPACQVVRVGDAPQCLDRLITKLESAKRHRWAGSRPRPITRIVWIVVTDAGMDPDQQRALLERVLACAGQCPVSKVIVLAEALLGEIATRGYFEVAEQEYTALVARLPEESPARRWAAVEKICTDAHAAGRDVTLLRYANLYGAGISQEHNPHTLFPVVRGIAEANMVSVGSDDARHVRSVTYVQDLIAAVAAMPARRTREPVYHVRNRVCSDYDVKLALSEACPELDVSFPPSLGRQATSFAILQDKLIGRYLEPQIGGGPLTATPTIDLGVASRHMLLWLSALAAVRAMENAAYARDYGGKISTIRSLEMEMLHEVLRICDKHNLKPFMIGGSLLGTVRHHGFIPWDDDMDLGFLREDYDVFRRVAPLELAAPYSFQKWEDHDGSHYAFDKVRVRGTRLSTSWTFNYDMPDGVFIDILVFDKTANSKWLQKAHIAAANAIKRAISLKWLNRPRENVHYGLSVIAMPFIRLVPWTVLHRGLDLILRLFSQYESSRFVIDGVGLRINNGAFPLEWLRVLVDGVFESVDVKIPSGYDGYLTMWYGKNYLELLPPSKRAGHTMAAIDLGAYAEEV
ncbi:MAG: LicD family protein [Propionibacteriaceae bacterium]|jgi:phosphorylcholine metabolism protein LicD|nr:LicD family protein [Propionibacteriaceae bacterium]